MNIELLIQAAIYGLTPFAPMSSPYTLQLGLGLTRALHMFLYKDYRLSLHFTFVVL